MAALEKQQVISFLKILQIPTDQQPEEMKRMLVEAGWSERDATEATRILHPDRPLDMPSDDPLTPKGGQVVAQKYTKRQPVYKAQPQNFVHSFQGDAEDEQSVSAALSEKSEHPQSEGDSFASKLKRMLLPDEADAKPSTSNESHVSASTSAPDAVYAPIPEPDDVPSVTVDQVASVNLSPAKTDSEPGIDVKAEQETTTLPHQAVSESLVEAEPMVVHTETKETAERPHQDAPWLKESVDIYDVTPEEREEMIRTVYRTNERLSPQTIHALLGIDVDLSAYELSYAERRRKEEGIGGLQLFIILIASVAIAAIAVFFGMYYFEVGPFHPTVTGGRG